MCDIFLETGHVPSRERTHTHIYIFLKLVYGVSFPAVGRTHWFAAGLIFPCMNAWRPRQCLCWARGGGALPLKPLSRMEQLIREIFDCLNRGIWSSYRTNYKIYCMRISGTSTTLYVLIGLRLLDLFFCTSYANMMFASSQHVTPFVYLSCCWLCLMKWIMA